ncbi:J domain-containing protein [Pedococcus sp. 5OH_020]|uniref:J domain-containing protein n=1 Tax=Pedococcus sp. 5OH_020 TaxID=2989814 RepID=UPI0022E9F337|nr:J domain-containing protein [Pedococcus sp. 5OH_020]
MTVDRSDPYAVLGLSPHATQEQIRHAYRTLMRQHHPDTRTAVAPADAATAAANTTLQRAIAAYATLGDPARRAEYDQRVTQGARSTPTRVGAGVRYPGNPPNQPHIVVGPVRWHRRPT